MNLQKSTFQICISTFSMKNYTNDFDLQKHLKTEPDMINFDESFV